MKMDEDEIQLFFRSMRHMVEHANDTISNWTDYRSTYSPSVAIIKFVVISRSRLVIVCEVAIYKREENVSEIMTKNTVWI